MLELIKPSDEDVAFFKRVCKPISLEGFRSHIDLLDYYNLAKDLGYVLDKKFGRRMVDDENLTFWVGCFANGSLKLGIDYKNEEADIRLYRFSKSLSESKMVDAKDRYRFIGGERHKLCKGCDEYYPATKEFFYGVSRGSLALEARCKVCYRERYKIPKLKNGVRKNIKSDYERV